MATGLHIAPPDVQEAATFITGGRTSREKMKWNKKVQMLRTRADSLTPDLIAMR